MKTEIFENNDVIVSDLVSGKNVSLPPCILLRLMYRILKLIFLSGKMFELVIWEYDFTNTATFTVSKIENLSVTRT